MKRNWFGKAFELTTRSKNRKKRNIEFESQIAAREPKNAILEHLFSFSATVWASKNFFNF